MGSATASSVLSDPGCKVAATTTPLPRHECGSERQDKYFTLFHTIISYSGIKYFNKSVFVLPCCNYKNECWLYFILKFSCFIFSIFWGKIREFVLYYEHKPMTGHMISFDYHSLESSLYTLQETSLAYPWQCIQLQLLLIYYFSFIAVV